MDDILCCTMETVTSRKNKIITHFRSVANDREYRGVCREFVCDGEKTLHEALEFGAELVNVLWKDHPGNIELPEDVRQFIAPSELFEYASPLKSSPGPAFTVRMPDHGTDLRPERVIVLENVQDPGNVGTVLRTANAFGIDAVILVGACADVYNPKTVRSSMGAIFRQRVLSMNISELAEFCDRNYLPLFGAALSDKAADIRNAELHRSAVAVGSEGRGLSAELLSVCGGELIIPMQPHSESLNAAVAASLIMWEMSR